TFEPRIQETSNSARMLLRFRRGLDHGGFPIIKSKPPPSNTEANSNSQWKKFCSVAIDSVTCNQGNSSNSISSIFAAPDQARSSSSWMSSSDQLKDPIKVCCPRTLDSST